MAYLGTLIAIPPSHASSIWPAAGIALAGIVTYGRSVIPGIWLGAFITQVYAFSDFSNLQNMPNSLVIGGIVSIAATAQAVLGAWLINRNIGANNPLIDDNSILRFFALGGPLSCMVSASIGIATLYLEGVNNLENSAYSWMTWWIGDVIGVLIFTPLLLCFIGTAPEPLAATDQPGCFALADAFTVGGGLVSTRQKSGTGTNKCHF